MNQSVKGLSRKLELEQCEEILALHLEEFVHVGRALKRIRDKGLQTERGYDSGHKGFENYCRDVWDWGKSYASDVMLAAQCREELPRIPSAIGGREFQWNERMIRDIRKIKGEAKRKKTVEKAFVFCEKGKVKLTLAIVRKFVRAVLGNQPEPKPQREQMEDAVRRMTTQINRVAIELESVDLAALRSWARLKTVNKIVLRDLVGGLERVGKVVDSIWSECPDVGDKESILDAKPR